MRKGLVAFFILETRTYVIVRIRVNNTAIAKSTSTFFTTKYYQRLALLTPGKCTSISNRNFAPISALYARVGQLR